MKKYFSKLFKSLLLAICLLSSNSILAQREAPFPLVNTQKICYANAVLQCLFQNTDFCDSIEYSETISPLWTQVHNLKEKKKPKSTQRKLACAIEVVRAISARGYKGTDMGCFAYELVNNLLRDAIDMDSEMADYYYYEQHAGGLTVANQKCYSVQSAKNGLDSQIDNLYCPEFECSEGNGLGINAKFFVSTGFNLVIVRLDNKPDHATFNKFNNRMPHFLQRLWQLETGSRRPIDAKLTGVAVDVQANQGGHAMNYSNYNGKWHVISDDNVLNQVGNNFDQMSNHLYNQLIGQLNGIGFADVNFLQATPSLLFYKITTNYACRELENCEEVEDDMEEEQEDSGGEELEITCCICMENLSGLEQKNILVTNCNHYICITCVNQLRQAICPLCRKEIHFKEEITPETGRKNLSYQSKTRLRNNLLENKRRYLRQDQERERASDRAMAERLQREFGDPRPEGEAGGAHAYNEEEQLQAAIIASEQEEIRRQQLASDRAMAERLQREFGDPRPEGEAGGAHVYNEEDQLQAAIRASLQQVQRALTADQELQEALERSQLEDQALAETLARSRINF